MKLEWRGWTPGQWLLRATVVAGPMVALLARAPASGRPSGLLIALVLALAVGWALLPESVVGVVVLLLVGWAWAAGGAGEVPAAALVAVLGMLASHLAALVVGYGPPRLPVPPGVVRLWAVRGAVVSSAAVLAWLLARAVRELPDSRTVWAIGLAIAVSFVVVATVVVQTLMPREGEE